MLITPTIKQTDTEYIPIPSCPNYSINRLGQVKSHSRLVRNKHGYRSTREIILKHYVRDNGYPCVVLNKKDKFIHRLLGEVFIPNPLGYPVINHRDGNKLNFALDNIYWTTYSENTLHAHDTGLMPIGSQRPNAILKEFQVIEIKSRIVSGEKCSSIAVDYTVSPDVIRAIKNNKSWKRLQLSSR